MSPPPYLVDAVHLALAIDAVILFVAAIGILAFAMCRAAALADARDADRWADFSDREG